MEKARPTPQTATASADTSAIRYVSRLYQKAERGDHDVVAMALARPTGGGGAAAKGLADVVVEVTPSHKLHSRLEHWKAWGYVDHKPCFSHNFTAQPLQEFLVQVSSGLHDRSLLSSSLSLSSVLSVRVITKITSMSLGYLRRQKKVFIVNISSFFFIVFSVIVVLSVAPMNHLFSVRQYFFSTASSSSCQGLGSVRALQGLSVVVV